MSASMSREQLIAALFDINAVKFGNFTLKSGIKSPFYLDLRVIVSHPAVLQGVADAMWSKVKALPFDVICGVPYTALPIATALSLKHGKPMVMRRKEVKDYGTKQAIEGEFKAGQKCLIVEDLVTSGISVFETVEPLKAAGLQCSEVVVLVDREQGARAHLTNKGMNLHSVITITEMMQILLNVGRVSKATVARVLQFVRDNQTAAPPTSAKPAAKPAAKWARVLSYSARAELVSNPLTKQLLLLMDKKQTNLCVSADVTTKAQLLKLADAVGPFICVLKTHVDILTDFDEDTIHQLVKLAKKHNFFIFEDRKFADIGNTVSLQYSSGVYHIADWAHIVNAHIIPGPGIIDGIKQVAKKPAYANEPRGLLLLAEMSSKGTMAKGDYTKETVKLATQHKDFVIGFISQQRLSEDPALLYMTPGVQMSAGGDALGQQYDTPFNAIAQRHCDVIIVGRGIYGAKDAVVAAKQYREAGWKAYQQRLKEAAAQPKAKL